LCDREGFLEFLRLAGADVQRCDFENHDAVTYRFFSRG
jgi:hypothetical protein